MGDEVIGYVVCDEPRGIACWMCLSLPYGYAKWTVNPAEATPLPYRMAHDYAASFGTVVNGELRARVVETHRAPVIAAAIVERTTEAAMRAQQAAMVDMCWTGEDGS